ncbi:hypothetical protein RA086_01925 [Lactiplantibacillus sp. WILCCON 0030]|uniref:Lipoprotein n=1 Tax=Lactiplantibacillus brownii TaxID=3069269 RepID=A0ABU1A7H5_9LACO|nr:hypothetical protein [Lactiplantibacillus brownii]MDQ7936412.1 hypothetical protein [Lactiplantibacillus brownii]
MKQAQRLPLGLIVIMLMSVMALSGCAKFTGGSVDSNSASTTTSSTATVLTKADQQISHSKIAAARETLAAVKNPNASVQNLATGLKHYQEAAEALNNNQLSLAKPYFNTLENYQGTTDASFVKARSTLQHQYQQVKLANSYYNTARDDLSVHELSAAKTSIDKLDQIDPVHPVIKQLQKKTLAMKQAIMNYEASQSTSSGSDSSTVVASATSSHDEVAVTSSTSTSSHSTSSESSASGTETSSATSSTSSSHAMTTQDVLDAFQTAAGGHFTKTDQFNIIKQTKDYYQIDVLHDSDPAETDTNLTDVYRYYPNSGKVTKQNTVNGEFK